MKIIFVTLLLIISSGCAPAYYNKSRPISFTAKAKNTCDSIAGETIRKTIAEENNTVITEEEGIKLVHFLSDKNASLKLWNEKCVKDYAKMYKEEYYATKQIEQENATNNMWRSLYLYQNLVNPPSNTVHCSTTNNLLGSDTTCY